VQTIDLKELYNKAFGVSIPDYKLNVGEKPAPFTTGIYGTSFYGSNALTGGFYFLPAYFDLQNGNSYTIPFPIIRVQSQKRIVETPLTERKGAVVELINQESWKIYIKGFIVSKDGTYPEKDILQMKEVYEANAALRLRCALTDLFLTADDRVVITDLNFPEVKGVEHVKPFEMGMISASVFDLNYEDKP
jgi:hypothetical protein